MAKALRHANQIHLLCCGVYFQHGSSLMKGKPFYIGQYPVSPDSCHPTFTTFNHTSTELTMSRDNNRHSQQYGTSERYGRSRSPPRSTPDDRIGRQQYEAYPSPPPTRARDRSRDSSNRGRELFPEERHQHRQEQDRSDLDRRRQNADFRNSRDFDERRRGDEHDPRDRYEAPRNGNGNGPRDFVNRPPHSRVDQIRASETGGRDRANSHTGGRDRANSSSGRRRNADHLGGNND